MNPLLFFRRLWPVRGLALKMIRRDIETRYRGSFLGVLWAFLNPLVMLLLYTLVFGVIMKARWPGDPGAGITGIAVSLFCGLIPYNVFAECATRGPGLVVAVPNYVKRVVFPLEVLPLVLVGSALFHGLVSFAVLLGVVLFATGSLAWTVLLVPAVVFPMLLLLLGLTFVLSSLGVFLRDLGQGMGLVTQVVLFGTPILYPRQALPGPLGALVAVNPLAWTVENVRKVVLQGKAPDWPGLLVWSAVTGLLMLAGYAWFMKTKRAFADVI
ncbi:MAG TPA: ABC transporter permease [Vicinamibacteria bacterium]|nr:ABC transporter permease [Vicinamibacteria bacterium]